MLTISQVATYAGVTVRAVRHYHQIGLLPEPERDRSGYRSYDAAALVRLIRIHTLADAGVPLARVQELLDADPDEFARSVKEIDKGLRAEMRRLRENRKRIARLATGESLALPQSVLDYLNRLRGLGVDEQYIELERDAWIMMAAYAPDDIDAVMVMKHKDLDDPDMVLLYRLITEAIRRPTNPASSRSSTSWNGSLCGPSRPARQATTTSTSRSWTCWMRSRPSPHRWDTGSSRTWRSEAGRAGPGWNRCRLVSRARVARPDGRRCPPGTRRDQ